MCQELRRLSPATLQVYGTQSRLRKWAKCLRRQHTIDKFDQVLQRLDELTEQVGELEQATQVTHTEMSGVKATPCFAWIVML